MANRNERGCWLRGQCYACGHRLRFESTACPQCGEEFHGRVVKVKDTCECERCVGARGTDEGSAMDKRKAGEGAMKGWATRRRRMADRREALDILIEVADSITSDLVVGERAAEPGKYIVGALTLVNWRDRITSALRILDTGAGRGV